MKKRLILPKKNIKLLEKFITKSTLSLNNSQQSKFAKKLIKIKYLTNFLYLVFQMIIVKVNQVNM